MTDTKEKQEQLQEPLNDATGQAAGQPEEDKDESPLEDRSPQAPFHVSKNDLKMITSMDSRKKGEYAVSKAARKIADLGFQAGIAEKLQTNLTTGINSFNEDTKRRRQAVFGPNTFPPPKIKTLWELIMENFDDPINRILLAAALVSIVIGLLQHGWPEGMLEGVSIMLALCIIITVSSGNNYASERRLANLVALADKQDIVVYRKGNAETMTISYEELVVGDLIQVAKGMKVPADCILVSGQNVTCKEDALTGEPDELLKEPLTKENLEAYVDCVMFAKATVNGGQGCALVLTVGVDTASGKIQLENQEKDDDDNKTLLQKKLEKIADQIGKVGYGCAILTFVAILIRLILEMCEVINCGCKNLVTCEVPVPGQCKPLDFGQLDNRVYTELLNTVIIAITVIVVAIPEGLPLAVTISLSFSSAKMQKLNNLVRNLASAETMGAVTHICSDKTGTLTKNEMTTMACMISEKSYGMKSEHEIDTEKLAAEASEGAGTTAWDLLVESVLWNSSARLEAPKEEDGGKNKDKEPGAGVDVHGLNIKGQLVYSGNVTEVGIFKFFAGKLTIEGVKAKLSGRTEGNTVEKLPFDSRMKMGTTVVSLPDGRYRVYTKGAPDFLMKGKVTQVETPRGVEAWTAPSQILDKPASIKEILRNDPDYDGEARHCDVFAGTVKDYARKAYRTILTCYKDMSKEEFDTLKRQNNDFKTDDDRAHLQEDLIAIGVFGIMDPLRAEIIGSVDKVSAAGIQVIMCTGDNIDTASAISRSAGILTEEDVAAMAVTDEDFKKPKSQWTDAQKYTAMEGEDFRAEVGHKLKTIEEQVDGKTVKKKSVGHVRNFKKIIKHLKVLARSSPEDKQILVTGLQQTEYEPEPAEGAADLEAGKKAATAKPNYCSVAVTGDGTNDAPALKRADVGFAMGITGTDVAKGACDIILLDDNFGSIVVALEYGRNIYDNVRKFLQFQLTVNVVAMFIVFFGSLMLSDSPLTAVQMLWVNLIMDTLAALALATEPPDLDILKRRPQPSSVSIVTEIMWRNVYGHGIYQIIMLVVILFAAQGWLVETYDVKCLKSMVAGVGSEVGQLNCPVENGQGALNPFFADEHYFELGTYKYWNSEEAKEKSGPANFEAAAWGRFQCVSLVHLYEADAELAKCDESNYGEHLNRLLTAEEVAKLTYAEVEDTQDKPRPRARIEKDDAKPAGQKYDWYFTPSRTEKGTGTMKLLHMTYVFQIFVFMQVFNQVNARILTDGFNIFSGICRNWLFVAVALSTFGVQMAMVEVGGRVTKTYPLEMRRNAICLIFGAGELFWGVFIKLIPTRFFQCFNFDQEPMTEEEKDQSVAQKLKSGSMRGKSKSKKDASQTAVAEAAQ